MDDVADDHAEEQAEQEVGQDEPGTLDDPGEHFSDRQARQDREERVQHRLRGDRVGLLGGVHCRLDGRGGSRRQPVPPHQVLGKRSSQQAPEHQSGRRARHGQLHRADDVHRVAEPPAVRGAGPVSAGQRHRPAEQADDRVQVHRQRRRNPDEVLDGDEPDADRQEDDQLRPALQQHPRVGREPDGREEHQQQVVPEAHVERHPHAADGLGQCEQDGDEHAADDGRRDAEPLQERRVRDQRAPGEQHHERRQDGEEQVELNGGHDNTIAT